MRYHADISIAPRGWIRRLFNGCIGVAVALIVAEVSAATSGSGDINSWRVEGEEIRISAENDVPNAYRRLVDWEKRSRGDLCASDSAFALNIRARIEILLGEIAQGAEHAKQALDLATRSGDAAEQGTAALNAALASSYFIDAGREEVAVRLAIGSFENAGRPEWLIEALVRVSNLCGNSGRTEEAVREVHRAIEIATALLDARLLAQANTGAAWACIRSERFDDARSYAQSAVAYGSRSGSKHAEGSALSALGTATGRGGNPADAEKSFRHAVELAREIGSPPFLAVVLSNLSINLKNQGKREESQRLADEALAVVDRCSMPVTREALLLVRAANERAMGELAASAADAEAAYEIARHLDAPRVVAEAANELSQSYAANGNFQKAFELAQVAATETGRSRRERIDARVAELEQGYAAERKQREIDKLAERNRRQEDDLRARATEKRYLLVLVVGGLGGMAVAGLLFVRERRVRGRATALNRQLTTATIALEHATRLQAAVIDGTAYGIIVTSADDRLIRIFNAGAEKILGYDREELVGLQRTSIFVDRDEVAARARQLEEELGVKFLDVSEALIAHARAGRSESREWTFHRKDGRRVPVLLNVTATRRADGGVSSYVGFVYDLTERKAAESAMRESEARLENERSMLRTFFRTIPNLVWVKDLEGKYLACNPVFEQFFGAPEAEIIGRTDFHFVDPELATFFRRKDAEAMAANRPCFNDEWVTFASDGRRVLLETVKMPLSNARGDIVGVIGIGHDVTARKQMEVALRESEERFRQAFDFAATGMALVSEPDSRWERVNRALGEMLGYAENDLQGRQTAELLHADDCVRVAELAARLRSGALTTMQLENRYQHRQGHYVWVRYTASLLRGPDGELTRSIAQIEDITVQKRAETALHEASERLRLTFDYAGIGMCLIGLGGTPIQVNRRLTDLLGYSEQELLRIDIETLLHPDDVTADKAQVQSLLLGETPVGQQDLRMRRKEGTEIWVRRTAVILRNAGGHPICIAAQIEDITDRRNLEMEVRAARDRALDLARLKSQFLANMSHEIRTPMNGIVGMADALGNTALEPAQQEMIRILQGSADSLLTIINDILDFSKIEAGRLEVEAVAVDPAQLIEDTVALFFPGAHAKGLVLACRVDPECRVLGSGDPVRIRQVLSNLVGNAVKFTAAGSVTVRATMVAVESPRLRVEVSDTGIGIPTDRVSQLFEPFVQADQSNTRKFGGTGLGLAICHQLMTLMGGTIGVSSTPGRGSVFWIELPMPQIDAGCRRAVETKSDSTGSPGIDRTDRPLRLLVAEDNSTNRLVLRHMFAATPHSVEFAENGRIALSMLATNCYDIALMDCQMPDIDGFEVTRLVRGAKVPGVDPKIPIVALTAYAMRSDRERCLAAGMDDYVSKPVKAPALLSVIMRCVTTRAGGAGATGTAEAPETEPCRDSKQTAKPGTADLPCVGVHTDAAAERSEPCAREHIDNLLRLKTASGGPLLPELAGLFCAEAPVRLSRIDDLVNARAADEVASVAHAIGGSAASLGAFRFREIARVLEDAARACEWMAVDVARKQLDAEWNRLSPFLTELIRKERTLS